MLIVLNLAVIALILGIGYLWSSRGLFSALLHLACTIAAGAIAFALWEPIGDAMVASLPTTGFLRFVHGASYGVALIAPFALSLAVIRLISDKAVPGNITLSPAVNFTGGMVLGSVAGLITTGMILLGTSYMRLGTDTFSFGYKPVWYSKEGNARGSMVRTDTLWLPADKLVAGLYSHMSTASLASGEPLARWRPDLHAAGFAARISAGAGGARNTVNPADVQLASSYTVGAPDAPMPADTLLADTFDPTAQKYVGLDAQPVASGHIAGYVLKMSSGAREDSISNTMLSSGQATLLCEPITGDAAETMLLFPIATISQANARQGDLYGRWRFDAEEVFIISVGGASEVSMAVEFLVPDGYRPLALNFKNNRYDLPAEPTLYRSVETRDAAIRSTALIRGDSTRTLDESLVQTFTPDTVRLGVFSGREPQAPGVFSGDQLGFTLSKQVARKGLELDDSNDIARISGGSGSFTSDDLNSGLQSSERTFRVNQFRLNRDQAMLHVALTPDSLPASPLSDAVRSLDSGLTPILLDDSGGVYEAIGYVYEDRDGTWVRFTPSETLDSLDDLPKSLSRSRTDQKARLMFVVSKGAKITHYALGDTALIKFDPPYDTASSGRRP